MKNKNLKIKETLINDQINKAFYSEIKYDDPSSMKNLWDHIEKGSNPAPVPVPVPAPAPAPAPARAFVRYHVEKDSYPARQEQVHKESNQPFGFGKLKLNKSKNEFIFEECKEVITPTISDKESFLETKDSLEISKINERTIINVIVVDNEVPENNQPNVLQCYGGVVIGGYPYDRNRDAYIVSCCDHIHVGFISFSYMINMKNIGNWKVRIPVPSSVIEKNLTYSQSQRLEVIREKYPSPKFSLQFVQMVSSS